ncbi:hypothetical protein [Mycobacterium interjectum]|uniref:hypothetical protein n=1 Tax=Mycobacterium interjectum TaxID=33895 RepID=UPI00082FBB0F|nr:hypothetical protein [Mycobacterium interjectum]MCV7090031.1 hypothetical protein [Mycobacterium interjectum]
MTWFRGPYELPDGGMVNIEDAELVPMGDVYAYRRLTYTHRGDGERPACQVTFEVRDGVPVCTYFALSAIADESAVRPRYLKEFPLDAVRNDMYGYVGVFTREPGGGLVSKLGRASRERTRGQVEQAAKRRKVTPELLKKVASVHRAAGPGARIDAVRGAFTVSTRTALRYIAAAKEMGLIDDE